MSNCWNCALQKIGGDTFLGLCLYFKLKGMQPKDIPPQVVDVGCKNHVERTEGENGA